MGSPRFVFVILKSERSIICPLSMILLSRYGYRISRYGYRIDSNMREKAGVVLSSGKRLNSSEISISNLHCAARHCHEVLLGKTAAMEGLDPEGGNMECKGLLECKACSIATGIQQTYHTIHVSTGR